MRSPFILAAAAILSQALGLSAETKFYRIDLAPSGSVVATDLPVTKGTMVVFHEYPAGTLVSLPRSSVKQVVGVSAAAAQESNRHDDVVRIGNLAMQGAAQPPAAPSRPASVSGPANTPAAPARWNGYDPWAVLPDQATASTSSAGTAQTPE